jgi:hypothetical protein
VNPAGDVGEEIGDKVHEYLGPLATLFILTSAKWVEVGWAAKSHG